MCKGNITVDIPTDSLVDSLLGIFANISVNNLAASMVDFFVANPMDNPIRNLVRNLAGNLVDNPIRNLVGNLVCNLLGILLVNSNDSFENNLAEENLVAHKIFGTQAVYTLLDFNV